MSVERKKQAVLATAEDVQDIARMSRDEIENGLNWSYTPRRVTGLLNQPDTSAVCMKCQGDVAEPDRLLGFGIMKFYDTIAHIILLAVHRSERRRGVGKSIIEWLERSADVAGMEEILLEVRSKNEDAKSFYFAHDFKVDRLLKSYYRLSNGSSEHGIRMRKRIREPYPGSIHLDFNLRHLD